MDGAGACLGKCPIATAAHRPDAGQCLKCGIATGSNQDRIPKDGDLWPPEAFSPAQSVVS